LCKSGEFSNEGATECSTCPTHSYTNASGQTVTVAATSVAGAGSATACYIDPDTYFTDQIGTYHFKENCTYKGAGLTYEAACKLNCAQNQDRCNDYGERHCGCSDDEMSEVFVLDSDTGEFFCWSETGVIHNGYDYNTYKSECKSTGLRWDDDTHLCYDLNGDVVYRIE